MKHIGNISNELLDVWNSKKRFLKNYYPKGEYPYFVPLIKNSKIVDLEIHNNDFVSLIEKTLIELESNYGKIKNAWLQIYHPNTGISGFHSDGDLDRNVFIINSTDRMFNYEIESKENSCKDIWNDKWKSKISIDSFNQSFLENDDNKIHNGKIGSIYSFGNTIHYFWNDSNVERISILFDLKEIQII